MAGFFFSSRRRHTRSLRDWSSDVCSSDLTQGGTGMVELGYTLSSEEHPPNRLVEIARLAEDAGFAFASGSDRDGPLPGRTARTASPRRAGTRLHDHRTIPAASPHPQGL